MGLFGKKTSPAEALSQEPVLPDVKDLGVIVHVMPRDFLGAEATLKVEPKPVVVLPPVVPVPQAKSVPPLVKKRSVPFWVWILITVLLIFVGAAVAYFLLVKSQSQIVETTLPVVTLPVNPTPPVEIPVETPIEPVVTTPELSKDSDSDGLTDIEERMYGTDYRNPDTDGDTFLDGNEVFHRYNPNGLAPLTLLDTGAVEVFSDLSLPFTVYYPVSWKAVLDLVKKTVTFKSPNVAAILISWSTKEVDLTLEDWILRNVEEADITTLQASYTKEGYYTLRSEDDLVAYVEVGDSVYVLAYDLGSTTEISYIQTFAMMVNSLTIPHDSL